MPPYCQNSERPWEIFLGLLEAFIKKKKKFIYKKKGGAFKIKVLRGRLKVSCLVQRRDFILRALQPEVNKNFLYFC